MKRIKLFEQFANEGKWVHTIDMSGAGLGDIEFSGETTKKIYELIMDNIEKIRTVVADELAVDNLSNIADTIRDSSDEDEFNSCMVDLYDWADTNNVWIKTLA